MNTTQQPEALNLEEFRAKVTHAAREPLLARIAELEAQLSATNPIQQGLDAQTTRDAVIQHLTSAGVLEHDGCGIFIASGDASELIDACMAISTHAHHEKGAAAQAVALPATGGQAQAVKLLAADHSGMKVDYRGLLSQVQRALKRTDPGHAEMLRQLEGHLQELGQRWYAGITNVVDEFLQLYCIERDARKTVSASATEAPQAQADARDVERWMGIGKAIERACADLPDGTEISVSLEKDAGTVTLIDQDGNEHENFSTDYGFAGVMNEAIDAAIAAQAKQGGEE